MPRIFKISILGFVLCVASCQVVPKEESVSAEASLDASQSCETLSLDAASTLGRNFMKSAGMIQPGEEGTPSPGIKSRWRALKLRKYEDGCLIVMNAVLGATVNGSKIWEPSTSYDAIGLKKSNGVWKAVPFESMVIPVSHIIAAIGHADANPILYYGDFSGPSAIAIQKAWKGLIPVCGFSSGISAKLTTVNGQVVPKPDGAASFDPTIGRTWKLANPLFDLRRGLTPEIDDTPAGNIDEGFLIAFPGGTPPGHVAPWQDCFIRRVKTSSGWKDVAVDTSIGKAISNSGGGGIGGGGGSMPQ